MTVDKNSKRGPSTPAGAGDGGAQKGAESKPRRMAATTDQSADTAVGQQVATPPAKAAPPRGGVRLKRAQAESAGGVADSQSETPSTATAPTPAKSTTPRQAPPVAPRPKQLPAPGAEGGKVAKSKSLRNVAAASSSGAAVDDEQSEKKSSSDDGAGSKKNRRKVAGGLAAGAAIAATGGATAAASGVGRSAGAKGVEALAAKFGLNPIDKPGGADPTDGGEPGDVAPELGAGGTGFVRQGAVEEAVRAKAKKAAVIAGTTTVAPAAAFLISLVTLLNFLKMLLFMIGAAIVNAVNAVIGFLLGLLKAVVNFVMAPIMAIGSFVSSIVGAVVGTAVTAAAVPVVGVVTVVSVIGSIGMGLLGVIDDGNSTHDGSTGSSKTSCSINRTNTTDASNRPVAQQVDDNAKVVYSVLSEMGMPKKNIAGILGNWSQESGIDATSVESIFTEPYRIGPRKQAAWDGNFTHIPGQSHGGIGLGQWSNGRTTMLLDYATSKNVNWYDLETQLAFMVEGDEPGSVQVIRDMIGTEQPSASEAARFFHSKWERSADGASGIARREADAEMWLGKMSGWEVDSSALGRVRDIVGSAIAGLKNAAQQVLGKCDSTGAGQLGQLKNGGLTLEEATALTDQYNRDGDAVLNAEFGGGGPGQCNGSYIENCVSFSWYFLTKYTSYDKGYAPGDGKDTASSVGAKLGRTPSATPVAYSIFSHASSSQWGHTGIVLGVEGDRILIGEAAYCAWPGRARWVEAAEWQNAGWTFLDVSDLVTGVGGNDPTGDTSASPAPSGAPMSTTAPR